MRKQKNIEVKICDYCGTDKSVYYTCLCCGKDACYECKKEVGVEYNHGVYFSGSDDGYFCNECDQNPPEEFRKLHQLYKNIKALVFETTAFYEDFKKRTDKAESKLKTEYSKVVEVD